MNGYCYIVTNPIMGPNVVKIGCTSLDLKERVNGLDNTSVPVPFVLEHSYTIRNTTPRKFEESCHRYLRRYRIRKGREFFNLTPDEAKQHISHMLNNSGRNHRRRRQIKRLLIVSVFITLIIISIYKLAPLWPVFSTLLARTFGI